MATINGLIIFDVSGDTIAGEDARLTPSDRNALGRALLLDACIRASATPLAGACVCVSDPSLEAELASTAPRVRVLRAADSPAGERIAAALDEAFDFGFRHLLLLLSSAATVPPRSIEAAFALLDTFEDAVIIGPTERDGVYAIGTRRPHPDVFDGLDPAGMLGYDTVIGRLPATECTVYPLAPRPGLVTADDVDVLHAEVLSLSAQGAAFLHTGRWFEERAALFTPEPREA
ncbi:MAG: DUF2064 domain-containing protein [Ignavibacteria bacterium]|nr:DUF2064 domain-containing protein [Ignavibacteria bacterium]